MSSYSSHSSNSISTTTTTTTTKSPKSRERLTHSAGMADTSTINTINNTTGTSSGGIAKAKMERHTKLLKTIDTASIEHLRMVLKMVCTESRVIEYALDMFMQLLGDNYNENENRKEGGGEVKTCGRCKKVFTTPTTTTGKLGQEEGQEEGGCRYHDGNRYVDIESEVWTKVEGVCWRDGMDMVVNCGVDWEDPMLLEEFAEGFRWDCCDEDGGVEGCVVGGHVAG
ncbi:hypothetical protein TWF225_004299 [Orbilia oligospora]|nr:hypothetical protein TWF225_004299 [Orbilia oligospora]KAF3258582.1 hypothetical protein TWF217_005359 [Orbilia oligospora]KAF3267020.1 hypothetical protein TWF128_009982 [Orbilia oligospora]KAF3295448.1 hypothetical protein TWF132_001497 [Orbilia oligospora]